MSERFEFAFLEIEGVFVGDSRDARQAGEISAKHGSYVKRG